MSRLLSPEQQLDIRAKIPGTRSVIEFAKQVSKLIAVAQDAKTDPLSREDERRKMAEWSVETCTDDSHDHPFAAVACFRYQCIGCQLHLDGMLREGRAPWDTTNCPGLSPDGTCDATETWCVPGSRTGCPDSHKPPRPPPGPDVFIQKGFTRPSDKERAERTHTDHATEAGAGGSALETHKCYVCGYEGTDVNRIAKLRPSENGHDYCCDDGDACNARIREAR